MNEKYLVYWNTGTAEGGIEKWDIDSPDFRFQDVGDIHDFCHHDWVFDDKASAERFLKLLYARRG